MSNIESNKMIAEFMQVPKCKRCENCGAYQYGAGIIYHPKEMQYDKSWDWLMPVCEKIRNIGSIDFVISLKGSVCISFDDGTVYFDMVKGGGRDTIETTYEAVINFIKWHNKNNII